MTYLIYKTQQDARSALKEIYANAVEQAAADDRFLDPELRPVERKDADGRGGLIDTRGMLFNTRTRQWDDAGILSRGQKQNAADYPLLGWRGGKLSLESGYTTAWAVERQVDIGEHAGLWAIPEPVNDARFSMSGVSQPVAVVDAEYADLFDVERQR